MWGISCCGYFLLPRITLKCLNYDSNIPYKICIFPVIVHIIQVSSMHALWINLIHSFSRCWWKKNIISSRHMNIYATGHGFLDTFSVGTQTQIPFFLGTLCPCHRRRRSQALRPDLRRRSVRRGHAWGEGCQELILQLVVLGDCGWLNCFCFCCHISSGKFMKFDLKTKVLICAIKEIWNH